MKKKNKKNINTGAHCHTRSILLKNTEKPKSTEESMWTQENEENMEKTTSTTKTNKIPS